MTETSDLVDLKAKEGGSLTKLRARYYKITVVGIPVPRGCN